MTAGPFRGSLRDRRRGPRRAMCACAVVALLAATGPAPAAAQSYTLDDWMSISRVAAFEWSPDGSYIYYTSNAAESGTLEIFRVEPDGSNPVQLSVNPPGERPEPKTNLSPTPDGETIVFTSARYFQSYDNIYRMPAEGGEATPVTFNDGKIQTSPAVSPDGRTLAYLARTRRGAKIHLLDLEAEAGWGRLFLPGDGQELSPAWSPDGRRLAFSRGGAIWVADVSGGEPRRVIEDAYAGGNGSFVWSPDGGRIAFLRGASGYAQVGVADVGTGAVTPITHEPNEHSDISWSPDGSRLVFVRNDDVGMSRDVVIAAADGEGEPRVLTEGKAQRHSPKFAPDGGEIAYIESTGTTTRDIWTVPADGGRPVQVTNSMGRIDPERLSAPEEVFYTGPDNLRIPAMLWTPEDLDPAGEYPVIVRLHGHPGQWNHGFEMMTQYFVEQGFVAIAPNPRGSRGFGQGFHDLHIGDYGGTEYDDVMNVLPYLDSLGYVDMSRKATWGGSGGGYMSFVIATESPGAFEAQVIRAPVSSWKLLAIDRYAASGRAWTARRTPVRERSEFGGSYAEIPDEYDRRSPINFVENVEDPQLLLHGLRDSAVLPRQSEVWVERMRELGKGDLITYVEYPDEDHGLQRYKATVRDRIERMSAFFAEHLRLPEIAELTSE